MEKRTVLITGASEGIGLEGEFQNLSLEKQIQMI